MAEERYVSALPLYRQLGDAIGQANCFDRLGQIALRCFRHDAARVAYEQALPLHRRVGDVLGEANCICHFGDLARAAGDETAATRQFEAALSLYASISQPVGAGWMHLRLARRLAGTERDRHLAAARAAWLSAGRDSLAARLDDPDSIDDLEW